MLHLDFYRNKMQSTSANGFIALGPGLLFWLTIKMLFIKSCKNIVNLKTDFWHKVRFTYASSMQRSNMKVSLL